MQKISAAKDVSRLAIKCRRLIGRIDGIGRKIEGDLNSALGRAWILGLRLLRMKEKLGHGNWLRWVEANLPIKERRVRHYLELAEDNRTARSWKHLDPDSVRKFRLGYVPDKQRTELEDDKNVGSAVHHVTLVNDFRKLMRRVNTNQLTIDQPKARQDLWPVFEWLTTLYGLDAQTIAGLRPEAKSVA